METHVEQFPRRQRDGSISVHRWQVDIAYAARLGGCDELRLTREVAEMTRHLPRWLLTVSRGSALVGCPCGGPLVFERGLRCAACGKHRRAKRQDVALAWFGLLPPLGVDALPRVRRELLAARLARHVLGESSQFGTYLLVPLVVWYGSAFPDAPPRASYLAELFELPCMPPLQAAHQYHMLGGGELCLYAPGQWQEQSSCRELIMQRAYPHLVKLLNYAEGKRDAFAIVS